MQTIMQEPDWLNELRRKAHQKFSELPVPQEREEEWRYTDLKKTGIDFLAGGSEIAIDDSGLVDGVIFTDMISAIHKYPELVKKHIGTAVKITDKFSAFHYANISNGLFVFIPDNKSARLSARIAGGGHTIIVVGKDSKLDYIEEYAGSGFMTDAVEIFADENSCINFASLQNCSSDAVVFSFKEAVLKKDANVNLIFGSFGSAFHRLKSKTMLTGEGAISETLCLFKGKENHHTDFTVNSHHAVPHTRNNVLAKGTVTDSATSVFRGLIRIEKEAQQTDSYLADHMLLLSDTALANSIPSLQIEANDVKASHGATVGQIDEEQLFYLASRGLTREQAEKLIVEGFFEPLINKIADRGFQEIFRDVINQCRNHDGKQYGSKDEEDKPLYLSP